LLLLHLLLLLLSLHLLLLLLLSLHLQLLLLSLLLLLHMLLLLQDLSFLLLQESALRVVLCGALYLRPRHSRQFPSSGPYSHKGILVSPYAHKTQTHYRLISQPFFSFSLSRLIHSSVTLSHFSAHGGVFLSVHAIKHFSQKRGEVHF